LETENELRQKDLKMKKLVGLQEIRVPSAIAAPEQRAKELEEVKQENSLLRADVTQLKKAKLALQSQLSMLENNASQVQKEQEKQFLSLQHENELLRFDKQELERQVSRIRSCFPKKNSTERTLTREYTSST